MSDPERWIDDPEVGSELQQALRRTAATEPRPYDADRGLARLQAGLAVAGASAAGSAAVLSVKGWLAWTLVVVGALGVGGAVYVGVTADSGPEAPERRTESGIGPRAASSTAASSTSASSTPESPVVMNPAEAPAVEPSAMTDTPAEPPTAATPEGAVEPPHGSRRQPRQTAAAPIVDEPGEATSPDGQLRAETVQLARVRRALESSPAEALRLAREGQRQFPQGVFAEERQALEVFALDRLGRRAEARAAATRFVARHPNGPLTSRVRGILDNP